jgi:hypothetical protein
MFSAKQRTRTMGMNDETRQPWLKLGMSSIQDRANTFEAKKPWLKLGMSRATWYRRRRAEQR